jgi:hypothetical protein
LAACGTDSDPAGGDPVAKSGGDQGSSSSSVDPAALDTGNYPTSPAPELGRATQDNILDVETQRLAEFVVAPFEVDPNLVSVKMPTMVIRSYENLSAVLNGAAPDIAKSNGLLYGYVSTAQVPTTAITDPTRSLVQMVLRFSTPDGASAAAQQIHTDLTTVDADDTGLDTPESIAILPNTLVSTTETDFGSGPKSSVNAFTAHGDYRPSRGESARTAGTADRSIPGTADERPERRPIRRNAADRPGQDPDLRHSGGRSASAVR